MAQFGPLHIGRDGIALVWGRRSAYNAARLGRYSAQFQASAGSDRTGDDAIASDGPALRRVARELCRNNATAKALVRKISLRVAGACGPAPKINAAGAQRIMDRWRDWSRTVDLSGEIGWGKLCRLLLSEQITVGEGMGWTEVRGGELRLGLFEPEQLAETAIRAVRAASPNEVVRDGVRYDRRTARKLAWLFERFDPGQSLWTGEFLEVPAERVFHLYDKERPTQTRGVSWLAAIAVALHDRNEIRHASLLLNKAAAYFGIMVTGESSESILKAIGAAPDSNNEYSISMSPGAINALPQGAKAEVVSAKTPAPEYQALEKALTAEMAVAMGLAPAAVSGDYSAVNYSSARMAARENEPQEKTVREDFESQVARPIFRAWLEVEAAAGRINAGEARIAAIMRDLTWTWPVPAYHDPEKEVKALRDEVEAGFKSWSQAVAERGQDPELLRKQIKADRDAAEALDIDLPGPTGSSSPAPFPSMVPAPAEGQPEGGEQENNDENGEGGPEGAPPEEETA